jgi:hypothetical protein
MRRVFHEAATAAELSAVTLDASDVGALQKCRPSRCQVKLPDAMMQRVKQSVDWSADRTAQVNALIRDWLAELVNGYRARGDEALPVYDDTHVGERSADGFRQLVEEDAHLLDEAPTLAAYLRGTTTERIRTGTSIGGRRRPGLSKGAERRTSRRTRVRTRTRRRSSWRNSSTSHYFGVSRLRRFLDRASTRGARRLGQCRLWHTCVLPPRRVRHDDLPSGGLFNLRGRVIRKLRDGTRDELARTKQMMETAYEHHSSSTAPRTTSPPR